LGLAVVVPRVLPWLERDPLVEGDFYPGDVLVATLKLPVEYRAAHPDQLARLDAVAAAVTASDGDLAADIAGFRDRTRSVGR
jgi:CDI immunity proteins